MAKKDKDNVVGEEKESGGSKLVTALIAIVIILIWLAVFAFLIKSFILINKPPYKPSSFIIFLAFSIPFL